MYLDNQRADPQERWLKVGFNLEIYPLPVSGEMSANPLSLARQRIQQTEPKKRGGEEAQKGGGRRKVRFPPFSPKPSREQGLNTTSL